MQLISNILASIGFALLGLFGQTNVQVSQPTIQNRPTTVTKAEVHTQASILTPGVPLGKSATTSPTFSVPGRSIPPSNIAASQSQVVTAHILIPTSTTIPAGYAQQVYTTNPNGYGYVYISPDNTSSIQVSSSASAIYDALVGALNATTGTGMFFTYKGMQGYVKKIASTPRFPNETVIYLYLHDGNNVLTIQASNLNATADQFTPEELIALLDTFKRN
jgi:cytoskeletal protein RodZ